MKRILAVDDNLLILKSLRRLFVHSDYEIVIEEDPLKALAYMAENPVDVVISDMRMPIMDGYQFLTQVKQNYPGVFRIVLSGYTDEKVVFEALKHNIAKLYISKPWNDAELIRRIDQIFETEAQLNSEVIKVTINNLEELPTLKANYNKIIQLLDAERDMAEVAAVIEQDPPLAIKLLHIANSAFFGLKTGSVKHAAAFLGARNLKQLVLSTAILEQTGAFEEGNLYIKMMWSHAFITNKLLQVIFEEFLGKRLNNESYSAGLLHNIGIATLFQIYGKSYTDILQTMDEGKSHIIDLEDKSLAITHQQVGAYLIRWWDLPYPLVESALYHHSPEDPNVINIELVHAVHIAQHYAWKIVNPNINNRLNLGSFDVLHIEPSRLDKRITETDWLQGGV